MITEDNFCQFFLKNICRDPQQDGSDEGSQHMVLRRNTSKKNDSSIIIKYSLRVLCTCATQNKISEIFFLSG